MGIMALEVHPSKGFILKKNDINLFVECHKIAKVEIIPSWIGFCFC